MNARTLKTISALVATFGWVAPCFPAMVVSVDMDVGAAGIQGTRKAAPGDTFAADIVLSVDAAGVSSYGISVQFDTTELSLNGATPAANNPVLPGGLGSLVAPTWNNAQGWVHFFNATTLGAGPANTTFTIGTINYLVTSVSDDGLVDVQPGFFVEGADGLFDNAGNSVTPTFKPGYVIVPEPAATGLVTGLMAVLGAIIARRRRC